MRITIIRNLLRSPLWWSGRTRHRVAARGSLRRQRHALWSLDGRLLHDVGLTPEDVRREVRRIF